MNPIFISYSRIDELFVAAELVPWLESRGIPVWIDRRGIVPGEMWRNSLDEAILDASAVLLIITRASIKSDYVKYEWAYAMGAGIPVIPVIREQGATQKIHPKLNDIQHVDLTLMSPRVWDTLEQTLKAAQQSNVDPRQRAADSRPQPNAISHLIATLRDPKLDMKERAFTARTLGDLLPNKDPASDQQIRSALNEILFDSAAPAELRSSALAAEIMTANQDLIAAFPSLLKDRAANVRYATVDALTRHFSASAALPMLNFAADFKSNKSYLHRRKAIRVIRLNLDTPGVRESLLNPDTVVDVTERLTMLINGPDDHMRDMAKQIGYELGLITESEVAE